MALKISWSKRLLLAASPVLLLLAVVVVLKQPWSTPQCVAVVDDYCIDTTAFRTAFQLLIPPDINGERHADDAKGMGVDRLALEGLIERELLIREGRRLGLPLRATAPLTGDYLREGIIHVSVPLSMKDNLPRYLFVAHGRLQFDFRSKTDRQFDERLFARWVTRFTG